MNEKQIKLKKAIELFNQSNKSADNFMKLFVEVNYSTRQGSGLTWSQVEEVISNAIGDKKES